MVSSVRIVWRVIDVLTVNMSSSVLNICSDVGLFMVV
jgi:hypothetical protein